MTSIGPDAVLTAFILFCRIGSCLMLMPGFSNQRVPLNVRLFLAFSITLALTPLLSSKIEKSLEEMTPVALTMLFLSETLIGALIGFLARVFFSALETLAGAIAMSIGLSSVLAGAVEENEPLPSITSLITLTATALIFFTGLHLEVLRGLGASYTVMPVSSLFDAQFNLIQISDCLTKSFLVSLRISSPFIVYAIIINLVIGLASKMIPQIPLYFITIPTTLVGGLFLFYAVYLPFIQVFMTAFSAWLTNG